MFAHQFSFTETRQWEVCNVKNHFHTWKPHYYLVHLSWQERTFWIWCIEIIPILFFFPYSPCSANVGLSSKTKNTENVAGALHEVAWNYGSCCPCSLTTTITDGMFCSSHNVEAYLLTSPLCATDEQIAHTIILGKIMTFSFCWKCLYTTQHNSVLIPNRGEILHVLWRLCTRCLCKDANRHKSPQTCDANKWNLCQLHKMRSLSWAGELWGRELDLLEVETPAVTLILLWSVSHLPAGGQCRFDVFYTFGIKNWFFSHFH